MDATTGSNGNGFDAALRALEDLETSVAQAREDTSVPAVAEPASGTEPAGSAGAIVFSEGETAPAAVITAIPVAAIAEAAPALAVPGPAVETAVETSPAPAPLPGPAATIPEGQPAAEPAAPAPVPASAAPSAPVPLAAGAAPAAPRAGLLGKVVIGLALVSSIMSAVGLVIAERTIMSAQLVVATARERQAQLESANRLVRDLSIVRDRQVELLKVQQAQLASAPVTSAELQHRMDVLQAGLLERDPLTEVVRAVRDGQGMTNARLNVFEKKMDRLEATLSGR
ncbi:MULTISPECIES: hypothetical protein [unclassified Sphingomonas]|uniref:hypothetical protein n=1 Tax=unclassified Sphingomonas TaxID=196159 RepID=UPI0006F401B9|nr:MULTISPECIES: hypothetical protein [unclassified Sphingomonas]KQX26127.1 hypothetical protein ASD17_01290 [Sphingomonas sp. Root1294]KQY69194.1 hypothetical protein ASD39_02485 [Sphingomonas sp. Root50]KRB89449.1 hypothetical protein ASE22_17400 [Sphingomonas sp. Root720]